MRILFSLVFLLNHFLVAAQNTQVFERTNGVIEIKTQHAPMTLIGNSAKNAFISYGAMSPTGMVKLTLVKTESGLMHEYKMIKFGKEKRWPCAAFMLNSKLYIVYTANVRKASRLIYYVYEINTQTLELGTEAKKILDFTYTNRFEELAAINGFQVSGTQNHGVVFWFCTPQITPGAFYVQPTGNYTMHFFFCNNELNLERSPLCDVPVTSEFRQEIVSPGGSMYFLFQDKGANANAGTTSPFKVLKLDAAGNVKNEKFGLPDQDIVDAKLVMNKKGELQVAGYCLSEKNEKLFNVFTAAFDTNSLEIHHVKVSASNLVPGADESKNGDMNYYLKEVLFDGAGNLYVVGEQYKQHIWVSYAPVTNRFNFGAINLTTTRMEATGEERTYDYGDVFVTCLPASTFEAKTTRIGKMQEISESVVPFASFMAKPSAKTGIDILFNSFAEGDFSRDERYVNDKSRKKELVYKLVQVNATCEKTTKKYLCDLHENTESRVPLGYYCKNRLVINEHQLLPDGSCLIVVNEPGYGKKVFVWK
ncbi:MAG TPA: hypothetical protein VK177_20760 [Flavobacteriales bacterium]|nr:hypothetical protein [Flavobacteriales bacterium]